MARIVLLLFDFLYPIGVKIAFFCLKKKADSIRKLKQKNKIGNIKEIRVFWGHTAIINIKYWSEALKENGFKSYTLVKEFNPNINKKTDFDIYTEELIDKIIAIPFLPKGLEKLVKYKFEPFFVLSYLIKNADVYHIHFDGGPLGKTKYWQDELNILQRAGIKVIGTAYGGDFHRYSKVVDLSVRHALLASYPSFVLQEEKINERVRFYEKKLDFIIGGFLTDQRGRWDILPANPICLPSHLFKVKQDYPLSDGYSSPVRIMHLSNHRFYTGTEFIVKAIEELMEEGLLIEFFHPKDRIPNDKVFELMPSYDIFVDRIISSGYGLAAIEAMAHGLPVVANLDSDYHLQVFRRYSFLNEFPVVSATPETIKNVLRELITNPIKRVKISKKGPDFVAKYHSYTAFSKWFGKVLEKLFFDNDLNLMDYFHPLKNFEKRVF